MAQPTTTRRTISSTFTRSRGAIAAIFLLVVMQASAAIAQSPSEVLYRDDFQSYGTQVNPPGWVDTSIGKPGSVADGLYKTWPDPTQGNKAPNVVYGTKSASGKPEGRNPRIGTFSTLTSKEFDAKGRFEFSGRLLRTRDDGRVGISVLSQYPASDKYYLLGLWSQAASSKLTMQLFAFDKTLEDPANPLGDQSARLEGIRDSGVTLEPNKWYRFLLRADDRNGKTNIQAKVWLDGTAEPTTWAIDASDASEKRLTKGHIGLWSAVRGENYIDEILAKSPVDFTAPQIAFFHATKAGEVELPPGYPTNADLTPIIRVTDDIDPNPSFTATLDDAPYTPGTPVTTEGNHTLEVYAIDSVGNDDTKRISFFLDKTPPTVIVREGTTATLSEDAFFDREISINLEITDASGTTVEATLNGAPFTPGTPLLPAPLYGIEKHQHELLGTVRDDVGNVTPLPALHFTIDRTAPVVTITKDDVRFSGGAFNVDVALEGTVADLTPAPLVMVLHDANGDAPYTPNTLITADGEYTITAKATDLVGHETIVGPFTFAINKSGPGIEFLDGVVPLQADKFYNRAVPARIVVTNLLPPTVAATLDDVEWPLTMEDPTGTTRTYAGPVITAEGRHTLVVRVKDDALNDVTVPIAFTIDTTPPTIAILESAEAFPRPNHVFNRDVTANVRIGDAITTASATMTLDDAPYSAGTTITAEGVHVIAATAVDDATNTASDGPFTFTIDQTKPDVTLLEGTESFPPDAAFNRPVQPGIEIHDLTPVTVIVLVDGAAETFTQSSTDGTTSIWTGPAIVAEGPHTISVTVKDVVGHETPLDPVSFTIDTIPPAIDVKSHTQNQVVTSPAVTLWGLSDDAVTVTVNGVAATINPSTKVWTSAEVALLEGSTTFTIVGTDRAGNSTTITHTLHLDTRGPALAVTSPANGACLNAASVTITGTVTDERVATVKARVGSTTHDATRTNDTWTVTIPVAADGALSVVIEAADTVGHTTTANLGYRIDRVAPVIEVTEGGAPFAATLVNRSLALFVRASDADPAAALTVQLDAVPYVSGTVIEAEGAHTLEVSARDCAGLTATRTIAFRIDKTAPVLSNFTPANGSTVGTMPTAIGGTSTENATIAIVGSTLSASVSTSPFVLPNVPFEEGTNRFTLRATDEAGNASEVAYVVTVKTTAPTVEILENGTPIVPNALFGRDVTPEIRSNETDATITATLNGATYTRGTAITTDDTYTLAATATDALGNPGSHSVTFRIDKTPPAVAITSPAPGASVGTDTVTVTGTSGDATSVTVNGAVATLSGGSFSAVVPLELGENTIVAVARDEAGNTGRAEVSVTRAGAGPAIVLLYPTDKSLTNRPRTEVLGRVITPANVASVTITLGGETKATITPDAAGDFRATLDLVEGANAIAATSTGKDGKTATAAVSVTADFTPPALTLLANGEELREGARFPESQTLTVEVSDAQTPNPVVELTLDGAVVATPAPAAGGGHVAVATARDVAGNQTRSERSFSIGAGGAAATCSITNLDPPATDAVIASTSTRIAGRSNAEAVRIAGIVTEVVSGAFCTEVQLDQEGENSFLIECLVNGEPIGSPVTMTLVRATGLPTVTIDTPAVGAVLHTEEVTVTGTAGPGVTSVSVNGTLATLSSNDTTTTRSFIAEKVHIAHGQNLIAARATTVSARTATVTRRVTGAIRPAVLSITSPLSVVPTGGASVDVSGTWTDVVPESITASSAAGSGSMTFTKLSDTDGTFVVREVPLTAGPNTIEVLGRDLANEPVVARISVTRTVGAPSARIESPADNTQFVSGTSTVTVSGVFTAAEGSRVEVNGVGATVSGSTFTVTGVELLPAGIPTQLVARVTEPSGNSTVATARVLRLLGAFGVQKNSDTGELLVFPSDGTVQVPVSAQMIVVLSHTVDRTSAQGSVVVEGTSGQPVAGTLLADLDAVAFAPNAPLEVGTSYTIRVKPTLADVAGSTLASEVVTHFQTEFGAPNAAPVLDPLPGSICANELTVSGTATASARVRIDLGGTPHFAPTDASGRFSWVLPITGPSGSRLLRVRTVGTGGALSPAASVCIQFSCETGPAVVSAAHDGATNAIAIVFSAPVDPATLVVGSSLTLVTSDNRSIGGTVSLSGLTATLQPSENLAETVFTLGVTTAVKDLGGRALSAPFSQTFFPGGSSGAPAAGYGYVTGEIYDATSGRPLAGATVAPAFSPDVPSTTTTAISDARGRYTMFVPEGAHTIEVSAPGYTTVWRQIIVPAGAGVIPIDIRLETRGETKTVASGDLALTHGDAADATTPVTLTIHAGSLTAGSNVTLTSVSAQSLAGLLPLGWSPLASAEVVVAASPSGRTFQVRPSDHEAFGPTPVTGSLTFTINAASITNATQTLTAARYDAARDEWVATPVTLTGDTATVNITRDGAYALVYPDKAPLAVPPAASTGMPLAGVADHCAVPGGCGPLTKESFVLDPAVVPPDQRTTATLKVTSSSEPPAPGSFPSGTAVQASIDEELHLADGTVLTDAPFAADLLLYRTLGGEIGEAIFHLAPSKRATEVFLNVGWEHIRINPYPGRLDRGTLIGSEGGRVPGDGSVTVDIPAGATPEPVRAEVHPIADLIPFGTISGFTIVSAFEFELSRAGAPAPSDLDGDGQPDAVAPVQLLKSASATFALQTAETRQLILAEVTEASSYGRIFRLASTMGTPAAGEGSTSRVSTQTREGLPLDGLVREGQYLLLAANQPIAYATGVLRSGTAVLGGALMTASATDASGTLVLGTADRTNATGLISIPVPSAPKQPFQLSMRHTAFGAGTTYTHSSAPANDEVVPIGFIGFAQKPLTLDASIVLVIEDGQTVERPAPNAREVALSSFVRLDFSDPINAASVTSAISLIETSTGAVVPGTASVAGDTVTWNVSAGERLKPNARYTLNVAGTVSSASGVPFGQSRSITFSTITLLLGGGVRSDRISITVPDANGVSVIKGIGSTDPAQRAVPSNAQVVPVRRGRSFVTIDQATADINGAFEFSIGTAGGADRVTTSDIIDLQVLSNGIVMAVIRLTPFVTADGKGFVAPPDLETRFTSADGVTVVVPMGAFDAPTLVEVAPETNQAFAAVPDFASEVTFGGAIKLDFEGVAKKRIQLELPLGSADPSKSYHLGVLGDSIRGARVMIVDTLRVEGSKVTTAPSSASARVSRSNAAENSSSPESSTDVKTSLLGVLRRGTYTWIDLEGPTGSSVGWVAIGGLQSSLDLFWDSYHALFAASYYIAEKYGSVVVPVHHNRAFEVVGVDASTGLEAFTKAYAPLVPGDPGTAVSVPAPGGDLTGPYPVFGTPFRVEIVDLPEYETSLTDIRNFFIKFQNGLVTVHDDPDTKLPSDVAVTVFNVTQGAIDTKRSDGLQVSAAPKDRIILLIGVTEVDPDTSLSIVFSEPIALPAVPDSEIDQAIDSYLKTLFRIEKWTDTSVTDVTSQARFSTDSGARRVLIDLPASLERGTRYRFTIAKELEDRTGAQIGQVVKDGTVTGSLNAPNGVLALNLTVRKPAGELTTFNIESGQIRDLALNDNVLLVSAMDAGVLAYDVSNPAAMTSATKPFGQIATTSHSWAVASDHHDRIYRTVLGTEFGGIQSFRLQSLLPASGETRVVAASVGGAIVSIAPGYASSLPLGSGPLLSDRAEAIPRKLQLLLQDDDETFTGLTELLARYPASPQDEGDFKRLTLRIPRAATHPYRTQRITVENVTAGLHWSADASSSDDAVLEDILVRANDRVRVIRNARTYGVVSLFGYGVGVYDLNAIESNDAPAGSSNIGTLREQIRLTNAALQPQSCFGHPEPSGSVISDLTFNPESGILTEPGSSQLLVYGLDPTRGMVDLTIDPAEAQANACTERVSGGLVFRGTGYDHPRLAALRTRFLELEGRNPNARFNSLAFYRWRLEASDNEAVRGAETPGESVLPGQRGSVAGQAITRDYFLVPGNEYGLLVVEANGNTPLAAGSPFRPLNQQSLVDIIWIPSGAFAVRVIPRTNLAAVVDREGRVLLVDLSRIDERFDGRGEPRPDSELFPTVARALDRKGEYGVGLDDPRIVWKSATGIVSGTLAPVVDPETGMIYAGKLLDKALSVVSAIDPRIQIKADLGDPNGLSEVGGVVPLGIELPASILEKIRTAPVDRQANASLAAFRVEITLPGAVNEALTSGELQVGLRSESVLGVETARTLPPSLQTQKAITLQRAVPASMAGKLRHLRGFNRFVSPWIVAVADPRASEQYAWGTTTSAQKEQAGCYNCERPASLRGNAGAIEIYSAGRIFAIVPSLAGANPFANTPYAYLGTAERLTARFATVMADTVRSPEVLTAAQNPAVADGAILETVYLHSGELATSAIDLDAGGRAGWNVTIDRTYRSRTIEATPFGAGWDSSIFRRLRPLPNGDVEYRDGSGEVWRFVNSTTLLGAAVAKADTYIAPRGVFLRLSRTDRGWMLTDQKWRTTHFDAMGRITMESDEFRTARVEATGGNVIRYLYDGKGRLGQIIDPVGRVTTLEYYDASPKTGLVERVTDWRGRVIGYDYDAGRLARVELPSPEPGGSTGPAILYGYETASANLKDALEIATNLSTITDPGETVARVTLGYGAAGKRDKVVSEAWGTGESVAIDYPAAGQATTTDALGQQRTYALTAAPNGYNADRPHLTEVVERAVPAASTPFSTLPAVAVSGGVATTATDRRATATYDENGLVRVATLDGVRTTTNTWTSAAGVPGFILQSTRTEPVAAAAKFGTKTYLGSAIDLKVGYQGGPYGSALLHDLTAGTQRIEVPAPSFIHAGKDNRLLATNDTQSLTEFNENGQPIRNTGSGGTDLGGAGSDITIDYAPASKPSHERGLPNVIRIGELTTRLSYPDRNTIVETDPRGILTTTTLNEWQQPKRATVSGTGVAIDVNNTYDLRGRLKTSSRKQGSKTITTTWDYDALGRTKKVTTDGVEVNGVETSTSTTIVYNLAAGTITTTHPSGAITTTEIDKLGRTVRTTTTTGGTPVEQRVAYDIAGNPVYATDMKTANASAFDIHGRPVASLYFDGTTSETEFDDWGHARKLKRFDAVGLSIGETTLDLTAAGRMKGISTKIDGQLSSLTRLAWDGAGRTSAAVTGDRAARKRFDTTGRMVRAQAGEGSLTGITDEFSGSTTEGWSGALPTVVTSGEKGSAGYQLGFDYDNAGNSVIQKFGSLEWRRKVDEGGNVTTAKEPNRPEAKYDYDGRGALTKQTLPDGSVIGHTYDSLGVPTGYTDQASEVTETKTDLIGRPTLRTYGDRTTETWTYDGPRLTSSKDRQNRTRSLVYNVKGQVSQITGNANVILETIDYDLGGRVVRRTNKDSAIEYDSFNLVGQPRVTRQIRYRDGSGLDAKQVLDRFEQNHEWNQHGERAGTTMPSYAGMTPSAGWTTALTFGYDAMGNPSSIGRTPVGGTLPEPLMTAEFRNAGRPDHRTLTTSCVSVAGACASTSVARGYGYHEQTGQMNLLRVRAKDAEVAGSSVTFDGLQRSSATLLGLADGARANRWSYDARSRLLTSASATRDQEPVSTHVMQPSDFREAFVRPEVSAASPASIAFTEKPGGGHKIDTVTKGASTRQVAWDGSELVDDGQFVYEFDSYGRLVKVTEKVLAGPSSLTVRRILYSYSPANRLVGRRAEYAQLPSAGTPPIESDWKLENRGGVIAADAIPAEATFVWDPISDTIASVFVAGASEAVPALSNGGLVRQIIHGGLSYDDPVEVTAADPNAPLGNAVTRLYPIYDEAGAGSLQAVLNANGEVVSRSFADGPYGEDEYVMSGPGVEKVAVKAAKDGAGVVTRVDVTIRLTEKIDATTLAAGARLAALDGAGAVLRLSTTAALLIDNYTLGWSLTTSEWTALAGAGEERAASLSIAVTNALRAEAWGESATVLPAPEWVTTTKPVFASEQFPVDVRESVSEIDSWLAGISAASEGDQTLYEVSALASMTGSSSSTAGHPERLLIAGSFHAHPFFEPLTGKNYVRNRWFDLGTGTWLTPDPLGYQDSSNLYAFAGGDPVNGRDPLGLGEGDRTADAATAIAHGPSTRIGRRLDRFVVHQAKNLLGAGQLIVLGGQASDPFNLSAKIQMGLTLQQGGHQIKGSAANWGTSAGELWEEPELLDQALGELSEQDIDEAFDNATDLTMILVTPLRGVGGKPVPVAVPPGPIPGSSGSSPRLPYESRAIRAEMESAYPGQVRSSTVPPTSAKNVTIAGRRHPVSGIVLDERGFPIFDDIATFDTKLTQSVAEVPNRTLHASTATQDLWGAIQRGEVRGSLFTEQQLGAIQAGAPKIPGFTWHHHQMFGRIQLIPSGVHQTTGHVGGFSLWYGGL